MERVQLELLNENNFQTWRIDMEAFLISKDCWEGVETLDIKDVEDAEKVKLTAQHATKNRKAKALLILYLGPQYKVACHNLVGEKEVLVYLTGLFRAKNQVRIMELKRELAGFERQPKETLSAYVERAKLLQQDLKEIEHPLSEADLITHVLMGLGREYGQLVTTMNLMPAGSYPTVDLLLPMLMQHEQSVLHELGQSSGSSGKKWTLRWHCTPGGALGGREQVQGGH